jgi:hypothetical protein
LNNGNSDDNNELSSVNEDEEEEEEEEEHEVEWSDDEASDQEVEYSLNGDDMVSEGEEVEYNKFPKKYHVMFCATLIQNPVARIQNIILENDRPKGHACFQKSPSDHVFEAATGLNFAASAM